jgi:hypothetical protein
MQRFGWTGGNARRTELKSGVIQMGAGHYANQDPVNQLDLTGEWGCTKKFAVKWICQNKLDKAAAGIRKTMRQIRTLVRQKRAQSASSSGLPGMPGVNVPSLPSWEDDVDDAIQKGQNALVEIDRATSCTNTGGA